MVRLTAEVGMVRLTAVARTGEEVVLKIEGWIVEEDVELLETELEGHLQQTRCVVLDLSGVRFIDDAGIQLLQRRSGERLVLRGASRFVQALLKTYGLM